MCSGASGSRSTFSRSFWTKSSIVRGVPSLPAGAGQSSHSSARPGNCVPGGGRTPHGVRSFGVDARGARTRALRGRVRGPQPRHPVASRRELVTEPVPMRPSRSGDPASLRDGAGTGGHPPEGRAPLLTSPLVPPARADAAQELAGDLPVPPVAVRASAGRTPGGWRVPTAARKSRNSPADTCGAPPPRARTGRSGARVSASRRRRSAARSGPRPPPSSGARSRSRPRRRRRRGTSPSCRGGPRRSRGRRRAG